MSQKNPPWVPEASESDHVRACWIALGTSDAGDMREGSHPCAWWDPQDKPLRPALEAVGENISFYFEGVYLLPQLTLAAAGLSPRCWAMQRGGRAAQGERWGMSPGLGSSEPAQPCSRGPQLGNGAMRAEGWGGQLEQAMPLHRQPKTTCSTQFPGSNFPSMLFFKALAFA